MDFDCILAGVYVGACPRSDVDVDALKQQLGITAVLNLQTEEDFAYWGIDWPRLDARYRDVGIEVCRVPVRDFDPDDLRRRLPACVAMLDKLLRAGHTVYVHCSAGINRSPSVAIAYLHWIEGRSLDEAARCVAGRRNCSPYMEAILLASRDREQTTDHGDPKSGPAP